MTDTQLLFVGPAFALLALLLVLNPGTRPKIYLRRIFWLSVFMLVPMVVGFVVNSFGLISLAFLFKPLGAAVGITLFFTYLLMWRSKRLPMITVFPVALLLLGSLADIYAANKLFYSWGGASC